MGSSQPIQCLWFTKNMVQRIIEIRDNVTKDISIVLYAGIFVILQRAYQ